MAAQRWQPVQVVKAGTYATLLRHDRVRLGETELIRLTPNHHAQHWRVAQKLVIEVDGFANRNVAANSSIKVTLLNTHIGSSEADVHFCTVAAHVLALNTLVTVAKAAKGPCVIAGDLNLSRFGDSSIEDMFEGCGCITEAAGAQWILAVGLPQAPKTMITSTESDGLKPILCLCQMPEAAATGPPPDSRTFAGGTCESATPIWGCGDKEGSVDEHMIAGMVHEGPAQTGLVTEGKVQEVKGRKVDGRVVKDSLLEEGSNKLKGCQAQAGMVTEGPVEEVTLPEIRVKEGTAEAVLHPAQAATNIEGEDLPSLVFGFGGGANDQKSGPHSHQQQRQEVQDGCAVSQAPAVSSTNSTPGPLGDVPGLHGLARLTDDGRWEFVCSADTHAKVMTLLEVRNAVAAAQMKMDGANVEPSDYILEGSFITRCHEILKTKFWGTIVTRYRERHPEQASNQVRLNSCQRHMAYGAYLHQTYNGKMVVDMILRYGALNAIHVEALNQETARDRQTRKEQAAALDHQPPGPPPNLAARNAARLRRLAAYRRNWETRCAAFQTRKNPCEYEDCPAVEAQTSCWFCQGHFCPAHHVPGYMICLECDVQRGHVREAQPPCEFPVKVKLVHHCQADRCKRTDIVGQCWECHRHLCQGCTVKERIPHCIVCPVKLKGKGQPCMSLRCPTKVPKNAARAVSDKLFQTANAATVKAGIGRSTAEGYMPGSLQWGAGRVHRAGQHLLALQQLHSGLPSSSSGASGSGTHSYGLRRQEQLGQAGC